jgi:hypothetical protein
MKILLNLYKIQNFILQYCDLFVSALYLAKEKNVGFYSATSER